MFAAGGATVFRNNKTDIDHPHILLKTFEGDGAFIQCSQVSLALRASGCRIWGLSVTLGTGLHGIFS
jgi:hypothetical protein